MIVFCLASMLINFRNYAVEFLMTTTYPQLLAHIVIEFPLTERVAKYLIHFLTPIWVVHSQIALWFELVRLIGPWWTLYRWFVWECSREGCLQLLRINMTTIWPISHFLCSQWTIFKIKFLNCFYIPFFVKKHYQIDAIWIDPSIYERCQKVAYNDASQGGEHQKRFRQSVSA